MTIEGPRPRVVSLLGAATEVIYALGLQHLLVGRSHECKRPPSVLNLPCVSAHALGQDPEQLASGQIDAQVRHLVERGLSRYTVDAELLRKLQPDVIITQDECGVCAVSLNDLEKACGLFLLGGSGACKVVSLKPRRIADVFDNIQMIADSCSAHTRGEVFVQQLKARWRNVQLKTLKWVPPVSVACLQWLDPLMGAGFWVPEIVTCAGGVNLFGDAGGPTPVISWHSLLASDPDVVVVMCCGLGIEKAGKEMAQLESHIEWRHLRAVKAEKVFLADGDRYFNNSGASVVDSAELMAEILHGSGYDNGASRYEGKGFVRWDTFVSLSFLGERGQEVANGHNGRGGDAIQEPPRDGHFVNPFEGRTSSPGSRNAVEAVHGILREDAGERHQGVEPTASDEIMPQEDTGSTVESRSGTFSQVQEVEYGKHFEVDRERALGEPSPKILSAYETGSSEQDNALARTPPVLRKSLSSLSDGSDILSSLWTSTEKAAAKARRVDAGSDNDPKGDTPSSRRQIWPDPSKSTELKKSGPQPAVDVSRSQDARLCKSPMPLPDVPSVGLAALSKKATVARKVVLESLGKMLPADCILLSGGLDTSILAEGASLLRPGAFRVGITVIAGSAATDGPYAEAVAKRCGMEHVVIGGAGEDSAVTLLEQELEFVVKTLKTFDPMEIRNSVAIAAALREAKRRGFKSVVTGDGADELFAGYNFIHSMPEEKFNSYRKHIVNVMQFSAVPLGAALGIEVRQPYLHPKVRKYASKLSRADLIGVAGNGSDVLGKLILREAFPGVYSAWRRKDPIEVGCGTTVLPSFYTKRLTPSSLQTAVNLIEKLDDVQIRDAEHLNYYLTFKRVFKDSPPPGTTRWGSDPCFACGYQLSSPEQTFCITCGQYPARNAVQGQLDPRETHQAASAQSRSHSKAKAHTEPNRSGSYRREQLWWGLAATVALLLWTRIQRRPERKTSKEEEYPGTGNADDVMEFRAAGFD